MGPAVVQHLGIDPLGGVAQRHFAKRRQIAGGKEIADGAAGLLGHIDFAFGQPLQQVLGRQIDQFDLVGGGQNAVGQGFPAP